MKTYALFILLSVLLACQGRRQAPAILPAMDTSIVYDTVIRENVVAMRARDSIERAHVRDSFHAIKPLAAFRWEGDNNPFYKMIKPLIDTQDVIRTPIRFNDTVIYRYDTAQMPVSARYVFRSKTLLVEVLDQNLEEYQPRIIRVNGRKLRPGIELDTALSGSDYVYNFALARDDCRQLRFGNRSLLMLSGYFEKCNGNACGVSYYILYDPLIGKGFVLEQFRSDFIAGYDRRSNNLLFLDMDERHVFDYLYQGFFESGKAYCLDPQLKIRPMLDKKGQQFAFNAYFSGESDSLLLLSGNILHGAW